MARMLLRRGCRLCVLPPSSDLEEKFELRTCQDVGTSLLQSRAIPFVRPNLLTLEGSSARKEPGGFPVPGCGGVPSGLVKLLAGRWEGVWGARLLLLGFPQVVIAEVALQALELGVVMVGWGVEVWAAGFR